MLIDTPIYGSFNIGEPLIRDLLASEAVQRLKRLYMGGATALLGLSPRATRYEHSVGAMLLVRRLGGSIHEQAASLLHDVSHTGLGHVVDYAFDTPARQAFHDDHKEAYLSTTSVPHICADHGVDWRVLANEDRWPLLEQPAPRLCADRIDYSWRDVGELGVLTVTDTVRLTEALRTYDGRIVFANPEPARAFAEAYLACDRLCWSAPEQVGVYALVARALEKAVDQNKITRNDLWLTDEELWDRICQTSASEIEEVRSVVQGLASIKLHPAGAIRVRPKVRFVDPDVMVDGQPRLLSDIEPAWQQSLQDYRSSKAGEWRLLLHEMG